MKLREIIDTIENSYPTHLAYDWDNVGLMVGDYEHDIEKIMTVLEVNEDVVDEAIEKNVDLIVSHHPFIFGKIAKVNSETLKGRLIQKLIKNDIDVYSMHTNYDIAFDGLNDYFMEIIGIGNTKVLDVIDSDEFYYDGKKYGIGRIGELKEKTTLREFCKRLKNILESDCVRAVGNPDASIQKVAVVTGAGSEFASKSMAMGADVIVTGDVKYHEAQDVYDAGMNMIDCGHFDTENIFKDVMYRFLSSEISDVEIIKSEVNLNPFNIIV